MPYLLVISVLVFVDNSYPDTRQPWWYLVKPNSPVSLAGK